MEDEARGALVRRQIRVVMVRSEWYQRDEPNGNVLCILEKGLM